jgi:dipeptidase E
MLLKPGRGYTVAVPNVDPKRPTCQSEFPTCRFSPTRHPLAADQMVDLRAQQLLAHDRLTGRPTRMASMELLLLSNSTNYGGSMFSHAAEAFAGVSAGAAVTFVPYALADWDDYADRATAALGAFDIDVVSAHRSTAPDRAILSADVVMMGGGNTFRLLDSLYALGVVEELGRRVRAGATRYVGASAGTNVACPTIRTTNDMPICRPPSFAALGLVPFQINLHYVDADPASTFMGETRAERITEFLEENDCPVLALYEGSWLRVSGERAAVTGRARLFQRRGGLTFIEGLDVSDLLHVTPSFDGGRRPRPAEPAS